MKMRVLLKITISSTFGVIIAEYSLHKYVYETTPAYHSWTKIERKCISSNIWFRVWGIREHVRWEYRFLLRLSLELPFAGSIFAPSCAQFLMYCCSLLMSHLKNQPNQIKHRLPKKNRNAIFVHMEINPLATSLNHQLKFPGLKLNQPEVLFIQPEIILMTTNRRCIMCTLARAF